jgi:hypothetical protein
VLADRGAAAIFAVGPAFQVVANRPAFTQLALRLSLQVLANRRTSTLFALRSKLLVLAKVLPGVLRTAAALETLILGRNEFKSILVYLPNNTPFQWGVEVYTCLSTGTAAAETAAADLIQVSELGRS